MNTESNFNFKRVRQVSLNTSERLPLEKPQAGEELEIIVKEGVIRLAARQYDKGDDITLAFACRADTFKFRYPEGIEINIEGITDTTYFIESRGKTESNTKDAIMDWIIQLHIVRNEANLESRLMKFFKLMATRLGKRTSGGLLLEHTLHHARIAEIVGSTRSTISRTISALRKTKKIYIDELRNQVILPIDD